MRWWRSSAQDRRRNGCCANTNATPGGPRIFGVLYDYDAARLPQRCMGHAILGSIDELMRDARVHGIDTVILALPSTSEHLLVETLNKLSLLAVDVRLCPGEFAMRLGTLQASHIGGHTFLNVIDHPLRDWRSIAKTVEDRVLGALILTRHLCWRSHCSSGWTVPGRRSSGRSATDSTTG